MRMLGISAEELATAGDALARGLLVAIPTETVYGLGADAFNATAVARVFEAKARPTFDPLIVHIADIGEASRVAREIPAKARALMDALWPGPLTLILPKRPEVPDLVTSGLDTVALRFPSHRVARRVIELSGTAVAAPSANPFGYLSPTTAAHVASMLGDRIDFIVDGGPCEVGVESTVLDMTAEIPTVLRPGGTDLDSIRRVIGEVRVRQGKQDEVRSPGQMDSHYAPRAALFLLEAGELPDAVDLAAIDRGTSAALAFDGAKALDLRATGLFGRVECLSETGDLREAAAGLFSALHRLDATGCTQVWAEKVPQVGLGPAINDRLHRASRK